MLLGKYVLPIRSDGQLALPSVYHSVFTGSGGYITRGFDQNVLVLTGSAFEKLAAHITAISMTEPLARTLGRLILGNAVPLELTGDGTLRIPAELAQAAGLQDEIVIVGQGEYFEMWSHPAWKVQLDHMEKSLQQDQGFEKFNVSLA